MYPKFDIAVLGFISEEKKFLFLRIQNEELGKKELLPMTSLKEVMGKSKDMEHAIHAKEGRPLCQSVARKRNGILTIGLRPPYALKNVVAFFPGIHTSHKNCNILHLF